MPEVSDEGSSEHDSGKDETPEGRAAARVSAIQRLLKVTYKV